MKIIRQTTSLLLRLAVGVGIIVYIFEKMDMHALAATLAESLNRWPWLAAGLILCFLNLITGMIRWKFILDAQGLRMSWSRVFCIYFIGQFFNSFLFGSTGGDLVRAFYAAKETHHRKTEAVATVIIDRASGLIVLYAMAAVMLISRAGFYLNQWQTHVPALIMLALIVLSVVGLVFIFNLTLFDRWPLVGRIKRHPKLGPLIRRLLIPVFLYRRRTGLLINTMALSFLLQMIFILQCYCLGRTFQIHLGLIAYLTVFPMVMSIAAIPITPGGLGIREGLTVTMFQAMAIPSAQSLPLALMIYFSSVVWSLLGGLIFLGYSAGAGHTMQEEIRELREEAADEEREEGVAGPEE